MKQIVLSALVAFSLTSPLAAQEGHEAPVEEPLEEDAEDGMSLMQRGAELFFRGLMGEVDPALKELEGMARDMEPALRNFREELAPALRDLMGEVGDWSSYHAPEMLPNGDIILRRKTPEELEIPEEGAPRRLPGQLPPLDGQPITDL